MREEKDYKLETSGQRMKFWIERRALMSNVEFADKVGLEHRTIYNITGDKLKSGIGFKAKKNILAVYPKFPLSWIRDNQGPIPTDESAVSGDKGSIECAGCLKREDEISMLKELNQYLKRDIDGLRKDNDGLRKDIERLRSNRS